MIDNHVFNFKQSWLSCQCMRHKNVLVVDVVNAKLRLQP